MLKDVHHKDGSVRRVHLGGWKKQPFDPRDEAYRVKLPQGYKAAPSLVDHRPMCSPIRDQSTVGCCTGEMAIGISEYKEKQRLAGQPLTTKKTKAPVPFEQGSVLAHYYWTRQAEGTTGEDSGCTCRDAVKTLATVGVADEKLWPFVPSKFATKPPAKAATNAAAHKATTYHAIADGDIATMKSVLADGNIIGFGFQVYSAFMTAAMAKTGLLDVPAKGEKLEGGHAVCIVGYDDNKVIGGKKGAFIVRNSWGVNWGLAGYFYMAYDYVANTKLCSDFWVVQSAPI